MIFSAERAVEDIYDRVRHRKKTSEGDPAPSPSEAPDPLFVEMGRGSQALSEFMAGIENNRDVLGFDLKSPIPVVGPLVSLLKRTIRRASRFYLMRQTGFNQYTLEFLKVLAEQSLRLSAWAREEEATREAVAARVLGIEASLGMVEDRLLDASSDRARIVDAVRDARSELRAALQGLEQRIAVREGELREDRARLDGVGIELARMRGTEQELAVARQNAAELRERVADIASRPAPRADLAPRLDVLVGLLGAPRDLMLLARADGPVPAVPARERPVATGLPGMDFSPLDGRADTYRKFLPHLRGCRRVLDLGCGGDGLLPLLAEAGIDAVGVDASAAVVRSAQARGLNVVEADLFAYLDESPAGSFDGICLAHLIEHFAPGDAYGLLCRCRRVIAPGGTLLLVTPNPESYFTQMVHFWRDPTHQRPYPLVLLVKLAEATGFAVVEAAADPDTRERWLP